MAYSTQIHTPYHFVPLSKWVYMPDWAHLVSHDVPLREGYSGTIHFQLTNATPLCVGGIQQKSVPGKNSRPAKVMWARNPDGTPVIPGSSLKGMIRSVLGIAGFGKFNDVENQRFSYRDISSSKTHYMSSVINNHRVVPGWIQYDATTQKWQFRRCQYAKVKHTDINQQLGTTIRNVQKAEQKYGMLPLNRSYFADISDKPDKYGNFRVNNFNQGQTEGHLVFMNNRIPGKGNPAEFYEFSYFFYRTEETVMFDNIRQEVMELFTNHQPGHVNYLKQHGHGQLGIPVFALVSQSGPARLHSFGFARMPRVTYKQDTHGLIHHHHPAHLSDAYFDLPELIFGTLREGGDGLKSRVTISDAITMLSEDELFDSNSLILNSPKPTFYPAYLEQDPSRKASYRDYNQHAVPAGTKRYIAKQPISQKLSQQNADKHNVASQLELAPEQTVFFGKLVFHNLHPVELGGLLWALELGSDARYYHQLGHGKPYGAGAVQINAQLADVRVNCGQPPLEKDRLIQGFVDHMNATHPATRADSWQNSPQLQNLLAMSELAANADVDTRYMDINRKEFQHAKRDKEKLMPFQNTNRKEPDFSKEDMVPVSFGSGRLAGLIDKQSVWQKELLHQKEQRLAQRQAEAEKQRQAEEAQRLAQLEADKRAARLATMAPCEQLLENLKEQVAECIARNDNPAIPPLLRAAVNQFLDDSNQFLPASAAELYRFARANQYHKTPRRRVQEQKNQLNQLIEKYRFEV